MNTLKYAIKTLVAAGVIATLAAAPSFALIAECVGEDTDYPNLSTTKSDEFPIRILFAINAVRFDDINQNQMVFRTAAN